MYKHTTIYYPHVVKQYDSLAQFITENGYDEYETARKEELTIMGLDVTDPAVYAESLSDDGFEAVSTIVFASEEDYLAKLELVSGRIYAMKKPIFEEDFKGESSEDLI